ncbi:uncharacterized protein LOC127875937 [Dreissena polymorpha]|uniref:XK-related protein n=1 Tax=Dreissena polymorpha TaxID=45954 RepID=A0A9D4H8L0_DREPO|nr:uncharacterized protein LOC127875937 [Dreissena polymorpha]KAH3831624.1 hypothetical protein DPMN_104894 [Dreissena polymorpha]
MKSFTHYDKVIVIFSAVSYVADIATDIALTVYFLSSGHQVWGALTLTFVALAALVMQVFSFHWHVTDRTVTWRSLLVHLLFLAPLQRYISVYRQGLKSCRTQKPEDLDYAYRQLNDISILRLFETFLEAAPQLVLQLYIVLSDLENFNTLLGFSLFFSLMSIAWAMTSYMDALHLAYRKMYKRKAIAMFAHVNWQTGMVTARVVSIVLFTSVFKPYVVVPLVLHFIIMLVWIIKQDPEFGSTACERRLFTIIASVIHILCFLNLKDGRSRYRMAFYYILMLVETAVYMTVWYMCKTFTGPVWFDVTAFSVVFGSFTYGTLFLLLYYGCCHHSGPVPLRKKQDSFLKAGSQQWRGSAIHRPTNIPPDQREEEPCTLDKAATQKPSIFDVSTTSARINLWLSASVDLSKAGLVENPDNLIDPAVRPDNPNRSTLSDKYLSPTTLTWKRKEGRDFADGSYNTGRSWTALGMQVSTLVNQSDMKGQSYLHGEQEVSKHSMQDYNLIEMFSRCKQDPSYVSDSSICDSFFDQTRRQSAGLQSIAVEQNISTISRYGNEQHKSVTEMDCSRGRVSHTSNESARSLLHEKSLSPAHRLYQYEQNNSIDEVPNTRQLHSTVRNDSGLDKNSVSFNGSAYQDSYAERNKYRLVPYSFSDEQNKSLSEIRPKKGRVSAISNDSMRSLECDDSVFVWDKSTDRFNLVDISPLDARKLIEQSEERFDMKPHSKKYLTLESKPHVLPDNGPVLTVTQDVSRGITHLSLSYSDLNSKDNSVNKDSFYSADNMDGLCRLPSLCKQVVNKSQESITDSRYSSDSKMLSFSDTSLPLPDASGRLRLSELQPDIVQSTRQDSTNTRLSSVENSRMSKTSPGQFEGKHSLDSFNSRDYSSSSYLSDRGMPSSDRGQSLSNHTSSLSAQRSRSSGFQSDESNMASPAYMNFSSQNQNVFQSTPVLENEILSISAKKPTDALKKKMSLDHEVFWDKSCSQSFNNLTPVLSTNSLKTSDGDSVFFKDTTKTGETVSDSDADQQGSPTLPPLRYSRRSSSGGSGGSSRFFTEPPTMDEENWNGKEQEPSNENLTRSQNSTASFGTRHGSSTYLEKSSLSAMLSDMSSSKGGLQSSVETISLSSESLKRSQGPTSLNASDATLKKAASLPYLDGESQGMNPADSYNSLPTGNRVSEYLYTNQTERVRLQQLYSEYRINRGQSSEESAAANYYSNTQEERLQTYQYSPYRKGHSVGNVNQERRRSSLEQVPGGRLSNVAKMAPKKLHELRSKSEVGKKNSPIEVTEYSDSPYKFRKPSGNSGGNENIRRVSCDSVADSVASTNTSVHLDYENLFVQSEFLARCSRASPESLSDAVILDEHSLRQNVSIKLSSDNRSTQSQISSDLACDNSSLQSEEISQSKSPINISGLNSAFRPVRKSPEAPQRAQSNFTFAVPADVRRRSLEQTFQGNKSTDVSKAGDSLRRRSNGSQLSNISDTASSFQWSQESDCNSYTGTLENTTDSPTNFLRMAGKNVLSFSASSFPRDNSSSQTSQHSQSDSIPWEDSVNKSSNYQIPENVFKSAPRLPLQAIDNTPVFSPIYGQDKRISLDFLSRTRFMSTPKLSTGSEISLTKYCEDSSMSAEKTPHRRRSSGLSKRTFSDNTSTWSAQSSECDQENIDPGDGTFALSKTAYI